MRSIKQILRFGIEISKNKNLLYVLNDYMRLHKRKGISLSEYFHFEFERQSQEFKNSFLGLNEQRYYLDLLNPKKYYTVARNKYFSHLFLDAGGIKRKATLYCYYMPEGKISTEQIGYDYKSVVDILREKEVSQCVVKTIESSHGDNVYVIKRVEFLEMDCILWRFDGKRIMLSKLLSEVPLIFESVIEQSDQFKQFNESSVNTVRFMTTLYPNGQAKIVATFMKIGRRGRCVDNAGRGGNVDAVVDVNTGQIHDVIQFDGWRKIKSITHHPDSGNLIDGVYIENWEMIKEEVIKMQQSFPYIKAAGWDIAITKEGPIVIEVNDFWDRTGQFFIRRGWRKEIRDCYFAWEEKGVFYPFERLNNRLSKRQLEKIVSHE